MNLTLTTEELQELTGKRQPSAMARWLRDNGFCFRIAGDGYPRVDRQHYLKIMGGNENPAARRQTEPNFDAMKTRG